VDTQPGQKDMGKIILGWIMWPGNTNAIMPVRFGRLSVREVSDFKIVIITFSGVYF
jgi:hypothetical protein